VTWPDPFETADASTYAVEDLVVACRGDQRLTQMAIRFATSLISAAMRRQNDFFARIR
jgi:hypothetical protein